MPDQADQLWAQSPLLGVILCCTSIGPEQRNELAKWATDMGAAHKYDLTSDVTHLVVGHIDTQKYKYVAKERPDVRVVSPAWLAAVRESWLQGGETDVEKLEEEHRVPTFHGLRVCITGFEDLSQRKYLEEKVTAHGGTYQGDLTKSVTHLIAAAPSGKKFDFARQWGVKTVSLEWLDDSVERHMALDETLYDPLLPQEARGKGAFKRLPAETTPLGKRLRIPAADEGEGKRKLRRTASTKLGSQSSAIWNDITGRSFGVKQDEGDSWHESRPDASAIEGIPTMIKADIRRSISLDQIDGTRDQLPRSQRSAGCFDSRIIFVYGFDGAKTTILQQHLHQNGAQLATTPEQLCSHEDAELKSGFLITPSDIARDALEDLPIVAEGLTRVNEWWVEKCLYRKKIVNPDEEVICKPLPRIPVPGFENLIISSTSFASYDRLHVARVVKLMGATYDEVLKEAVSVLICNSDSPMNTKAKYCLDRSIPVVAPSWLWGCISAGAWQPFEAHAMHLGSRESSEQPQTRKSSVASAGVASKERALREQSRHNKLALSKTMPLYRHELARQASLSKPEPGKSGERKQARASGPAPPLYESASEDGYGGAGAAKVAAAVSDDDPVLPYPDDDITSQPKQLQELSSSDANALRKPSSAGDATAVEQKQPQHPNSLSSPLINPPAAATAPLQAGKPSSADLNNTIAALLAQKKQKEAARPASAGSDNAGGGVSRSSRQQRRRQLGRAPSITSNGSAPTMTSQNSFSTTTAKATSASGADNIADKAEMTAAAAAAPPWTDPTPASSQALVWGDTEGAAERAEVIRRLGGKIAEDGDEGGAAGGMRPVERIGRVADGAAGGAGQSLGARVMRRRAAGGRAL